MENAVDALKMAAAVLIFVIAIGSSFSLFGTAKHTADSIITMRDKQAYLEAAELDGGILYTSSSKIQEENEEDTDNSSIAGVTTKGDRIVKVEDVISTIYRYSKEKYGVTIMKKNGTIIARYDSNTDQVMSLWNSIKTGKKEYIEKLKNNTKTDYISENPKFSEDILEKLYKIKINNASESAQKCGAPWYGNEEEIRKKIACDINKTTYTYNGQTYEGIGLRTELKDKKIVEVTNEIDNSTYLKDGETPTDLLQMYEMPTIEVVYIILD